MSDLRETLRVPAEELSWSDSLDKIVGDTTAGVKPHEGIIGQSRAVKAIRLGLAMKSKGYNIFVAGYPGAGRTTTVEKLIKEIVEGGPIPDDLCYVMNFKNPDEPRLLQFPAGKGREFMKHMTDLVESAKKKVPAVFESEEFQAARNEIINRHMGKQKALFKNFENKVSAENFMMVQVQVGPFTRPDLAPVVVGNPMKIEQLEALVEEGKFSAEELERIKEKYKELSSEMEKLFKEARDIDKSIQEGLEKLAREWVEPMLADMMTPIVEAYQSDSVRTYLGEVQADIVEHLDRFRPKLVPQGPGMEGGGPPMMIPPEPSQFREYAVNLVVDNSESSKPPVLIETTPTFRNLFGTIERVMDMRGMWASDHRHIKAGSLLRSNGGYILLNAREVLTEVGVWPTLKRTLRFGFFEIQTDPFSFLFTSVLKPEKVPINVKVVLIGEPEIYDIVQYYDEDFQKIFKIKADFDTSMPNNAENITRLVGFIARVCSEENLLPLDPAGAEAVAKLGIRWAGRKKKITTQFERIADLIREADLKAREDGKPAISREHVERANADRIERVNMIEDKIQEYIEDGILMIDTSGEQIGQINGLSVYSLPEISFGRPSRITAKISMGKAGIINISGKPNSLETVTIKEC